MSDAAKRIRGLVNSTTHGKWTAVRLGGHTVDVRTDEPGQCAVVNWQGFDDGDRSHEDHLANAEFIAAMKRLAPELCDVVDAASRMLKGAQCTCIFRYSRTCDACTASKALAALDAKVQEVADGE